MKPHLTLCLTALLLPGLATAQARPQDPEPASAATPATEAELPRWEQLSAEQRELLVAPLRERWNAQPGERARMLRHAQRWKQLPPEARQRAQRGMRRFEQMDPEQRRRARAIFEAMRDMTPEQRSQFRQQWERMTPEQRQQWLQARPAPQRP